jgi:hypothetical protein
MWEQFKAFAYKWIGGLFLEDKNGVLVVSLGRVSFLVVLGWMLVFWSRWYFTAGAEANLPPGLLEVFYTLAAYVFGSKVTDVLRAKFVPALGEAEKPATDNTP